MFRLTGIRDLSQIAFYIELGGIKIKYQDWEKQKYVDYYATESDIYRAVHERLVWINLYIKNEPIYPGDLFLCYLDEIDNLNIPKNPLSKEIRKEIKNSQ